MKRNRTKVLACFEKTRYITHMDAAIGAATQEPEKIMSNQQISQAIIDKIEEGFNVRDAYDAVLGAGAYKKMADMIYDELKAKAA